VDHFGSSINLGNLLTEIGANNSAGKYYQNAKMLHPQSISAHFGLILSIKTSTGDCEAAIKIFKNILRTDPSNYQVLTQLATIRFFLQQDEKCVTLLYKALAIKNDYLPALATMCELMRMRGCHDKAKLFYEKLLKLDPKQPTIPKALAKISF
jgi:tetratricopeptide (TPR) repeat protein